MRLESLNLKECERILCEEALRTSKSMSQAAEKLGITRHSLRRKMKNHGLYWPPVRWDPERFKEWLKTPYARKTIHEAKERADEAVERLEKTSRVDPSVLDKRFTI